MANQPRISTQPRLMLDINNVIFEMADDIMPKLDDKGAQKIDRESGLPMWTAPMVPPSPCRQPRDDRPEHGSPPQSHRLRWRSTIRPWYRDKRAIPARDTPLTSRCP